MMNDAVLVEKIGRILVIKINRPEAMNSVNANVANGIGKALEDYAKNRDLWCAIITGSGEKSFCAGADLKAVGQGESIMPDNEAWGFAGITKHFVNKPIIAAVNGFALGGGTEIALACDLVVASEQATFGLPEVKHGIVAGAGGLLRLPRQVPLKIAMEKILTAEPISNDEALKWGLINKVVPHEQLMDEAIRLGEKIMENGPIAVSISKEIVYRSLDVSLDHPDEAWKISEQYSERLMGTKDSMEGLRAFSEKRKPQWQNI